MGRSLLIPADGVNDEAAKPMAAALHAGQWLGAGANSWA